jgi:recombination protein RecT
MAGKGNGSAGTTLAPAAGAAPRRNFLVLLEQSRSEIAKTLPAHVDADRVIRVARTAYQLDPKIRGCTPESILGAVLKACELGLEPGGALGHAYLIPYRDECVFQPSYKGLLELARRSGLYRSIEARAVFKGDAFRLAYTPRAEMSHVPSLDDDPGPLTHAYAYAYLAGQEEPVFEIVTRAQVEAARSCSRAPGSLMWTKFYEEGAKKVALRRLLKRQPLSVELAQACEADDAGYDLDRGTGAATATVRPARGAAALADRLALAAPDDEPAFEPDTPSRIYTEADDPPAEVSREPGTDS